MEVPLVLTVAIEENAFQFFNALKKIYFPTEGAFPDAHLTLFHLLPNEPSVVDTIESVCKQYKTIDLTVKEPAIVDDGVVYEIESPQLIQLHETLQKEWNAFLLPEDRQKPRFYILVQNKLSAQSPDELLQFLNENFGSFHAMATGLQLWEYNDGPRKLLKEFAFNTN